jgi:ectoine hydroxylase-related dioxygenase (phytanoyl-CoA dioxygenase family)
MNSLELQRLPPDCTTDDIIEANERDGGVIVDGWLGSELLKQFNAELEPWLARHEGTSSGSDASDNFLGRKTRRVQGLAVKAPAFIDIMIDERIVGFAEAVLAPVSPSVILNNGEVIDIGPGESAQPFHRDDGAWNFANATNPLMINTIAALVDITPVMGATMVVPGSHRWSHDRTPTEDEIVTCNLPAGSTLFFRGDTLHAGGANKSTKRRRAVSTGICCGWLRPVENSYTNIPLEVVSGLPQRAQELLGYALYDASTVGGGYLGYHDMGDPMKLFT